MDDFDDDEDMSFEESLSHDEMGPVTVETLQSIEQQINEQGGVPVWAVVQNLFVPTAHRIMQDAGSVVGGRAASFVRSTLEEVIRTTPDSGDDLPDLALSVTGAMTLLGSYYYDGVLGEQDYAKAFEYYQAAAERGGIRATLNLGYCYQYAHGTERDDVKACNCYNVAYLADPTNPGGRATRWPICSSTAYGVPRNEKVAMQAYLDILDVVTDDDMQDWFAENEESLYRRLALAYRDGRGVKRSPLKALEYYEKLEIIHYRDLAHGRRDTPYYSTAQRPGRCAEGDRQAAGGAGF
ncbi:tetratricopeptide repeat protein [Bifidobacterium thermacidophilum]|uniref:Tpr repeat protein n=1 Tax=Bifidobacterium thermacidophilum subsp. thermacidophilum TaxID=79262 RepID=A0A087E440_9BIFI|nr:tetratricopeptide repeat protein [Bifidobacterium thermacidophilum]KFJ02541.1 tpr repeat protein [Bifidobacterium thermacidophilum subsp. thermacidophilum]